MVAHPQATSVVAGPAFAGTLLDAARSRTAASPHHVRVRLGGACVDVRFDGPGSAGALLPAWRPLIVDPDDEAAMAATPEATLHVLTADASGPSPAAPWGRAIEAAHAASHEALEFFDLAGTVGLWEASARTGVWWAPRPETFTVHDRIQPLLPLLRWALRGADRPVLRAGLVGSARGGLLIAGGPGSGRSTTVLAARRLGLAALSDAATVVAPGELRGFPLTGYATATTRTIALLPELMSRLAPLPRTPLGQQAVVLDARPLRATDGMPLRAVVVVRLGDLAGAPLRILPQDAAAAVLPALTPMLPGTRPVDLRLAATLADALPVYGLTVGPEVDAVAGALARILRDQA
ncbi:MAG: hypothetical protein PGN13_02170 [Patulibacter minatonensis]